MKRRVAITGLGTLNPLGNDVATTWERVAQGESGIGPITHFDAAEHKTRFAGEVKDFDPVAHFGRKDARRMERVAQLALAAAAQALADSGLENDSWGAGWGPWAPSWRASTASTSAVPSGSALSSCR